MNLYRIRDWKKIYENNRTREMVIMSWLPLPVRLSGNGYVHVMGLKNGSAIFGCFIGILEAASQSKIRGELWRTAVIPHSPRTLAAVIRHPENLIAETFTVCNSPDCDWIEAIEIKEDTTTCGIPAANLRDTCGEPAGYLRYNTEQNNTEQNRTEEKNTRAHAFSSSPYFDITVLIQHLPEWSKAKIEHYHASAADYSAQKGKKYLDWLAAMRNWARRDDQEGKGFKEPQKYRSMEEIAAAAGVKL